MSKKLQGNGLWESSRMILPEHRTAYLQQRKEQERINKPQLDEQEQEYIYRLLTNSLKLKSSITLSLFEPFGNRKVTGVVTAINRQQQLIKLTQDDESLYIAADDIVHAVFDHECL